jgi:hypothetical protein
MNLHFISFNAIIGVQQRRLDFLCELFRQIVGSLTSGTAIFIIIDGVSWFEKEPLLEELSFAIVRLRDLVIECSTSGMNNSVILKLLITSSKVSIHTKHLFLRETQLVILNDTLGNAVQQQRRLGSASSTSNQESERLSWMSASTEGTGWS